MNGSTMEIPSQMQTARGSNKKQYIETLNIRRLGYLERAACLQELIEELGGSTEEMDGAFTRNGQEEPETRRPRNRAAEDEGEEETSEGGRTRLDGGPDHRFKGNETEAIQRSRHQSGDGRGQVTDPETDHRLKGNETEALAAARHNGDDGRGAVTDEETDKRLKPNQGKRK
jgi:hypothetical protein